MDIIEDLKKDAMAYRRRASSEYAAADANDKQTQTLLKKAEESLANAEAIERALAILEANKLNG